MLTLFVYIIETKATEFFVSLSPLCFAVRNDLEVTNKAFPQTTRAELELSCTELILSYLLTSKVCNFAHTNST